MIETPDVERLAREFFEVSQRENIRLAGGSRIGWDDPHPQMMIAREVFRVGAVAMLAALADLKPDTRLKLMKAARQQRFAIDRRHRVDRTPTPA